MPLGFCLAAACGLVSVMCAQTAVPSPPPEFFRTYCFECHGTAKPKGKVSVERMVAAASVGPHADNWEKVAEMIETSEMPSDDAKAYPTDAERAEAVSWVRSALKTYETAHAGEPGRVTVRRLTSGEYAYAVRDLTGIELNVGLDASSDSVGGEGFTNFGDVQFVQDATIERFLEAAKAVADHAVIGAGPLQFYADAGKTGVELSALARIDELYASKGFRVVSGEGGRPFGLDRYGKAFFVSWYYKNRAALGDPQATVRGLAAKEDITGQFAEHIWSVVNRPNPGYPSREFIGQWQALPKPTADVAASIAAARAGCDTLYKRLTTWPSWFFARGDLAAGGQGDESPLEFDDLALKADPGWRYTYRLGAPVLPPAPAGVKPVIFMPTTPGPWTVHLSFDNVNPLPGVKPVVIWRNPRIVTRVVVPPDDNTFFVGAKAILAARQRSLSGDILATQSLRSVLPADQAAALKFGKSPDGTAVGPDDFVATGPVTLHLAVPAVAPDIAFEAKTFFFEADAEIGRDRNAVIRVQVSHASPADALDKRHRILVGDPASAGYKTFRAGMAEYVALLPPNSHGEANPADKDPVPLPFDNTYNGAEHDAFVLKVKYQRHDDFFTEKLVDGADRARLNEAWNDLFGSWPYHTAYLNMLVDHYGLKLPNPRIEDMDAARIAALPAEARPYVAALRQNYDEVMKARTLAQSGHLENALDFASRAWRRPLTAAEQTRLKAFYAQARTAQALDHDDAIKALLARILVSPAFLYRLEPVEELAERPLDDWELASRMSFFLWSSIPDDELRRAAAAGELHDPAMLAKQVRRMTADPKARRLATEFFGQWLGFYRFDEFRGVDTGRFPEFTDEVKTAMYDEAVSTFEYLVRQDRPVREMLYADYTFLNQPLAKFYGIDASVKSAAAVERVEGAHTFNRGGALRLGAVLTTTSAPLRTSPVKRGDWILRRILGTPTPPPPADAGTLPSDPNAFGGLTLREKLAVHKRNATCANCHLRIDPLGFPLEGFDAVGRPRTAYQDGGAVDVTGEFADKSTISGVDGLLGYLHGKDAQIRKTLAKKMLGYALGRTVLASDRALVDSLIQAGDNATFSDLALKIVGSRQFRNRQGDESVHSVLQNEAPSVASLAKEGSSASEHPMNARSGQYHMSRRHFLRGVGVALALPWLESMPLYGQIAGAATKVATPPLRLGVVFFSNGVEPAHWWAKGSGATMEMGPALSAMMPHREDMVFVNGLYNQSAFESTSPHLGRMNLLSGASVSLDPGDIRVGTSMDQVLAAHIGHQTAVPSLVLGIEPNELRLEDGLSMIYGSSLSWVSPTKPATKEIYPSRAFDRLVGDGTGRKLDRSILDEVRDDSAGLKRKVSRDDSVKLQEYFESIRDIEKRIERANQEERLEGWRPTLAQPNMPRPANELPQNVPDHMKLMLDLTVLAFQMDKTRIATLMLNNDLSQMNFKFLQGVQGALHLDLTHNGHAVDKEAMYLKTNQFHIAQFAYLTQRMKEIKEGEGTMLDNSILMMASSLFDGDAHSANQLPILLTGKGGGSLKTGRVLDYLAAGDAQRKACSLHLSLMDRMGVKLDRFGDATTRLENL